MTEWPENTALYRAKSTPDPYVVSSLLAAHFYEADRCVAVFQSIQADELCEIPLRQTNS
ncbi:unnamed protein product, partial [Aphanomyces euteiches]